jgi:hypothetical protein
MLKMGGSGHKDGKPVRFIVFGLSHKNLEELKAKHPITCSIRDFKIDADIDIIIFSGETEQSMQREMAELVGPETDVQIDPRLRD